MIRASSDLTVLVTWVEWRCRFESFELQWASAVTLEEWCSGKGVTD